MEKQKEKAAAGTLQVMLVTSRSAATGLFNPVSMITSYISR
jgi:hypothetical protein